MTVCVFASSSSRIDNEYATAATSLGILLAQAKIDVVYGGGGIGLMSGGQVNLSSILNPTSTTPTTNNNLNNVSAADLADYLKNRNKASVAIA